MRIRKAKTMKKFTNLIVWQEAHKLVIQIYTCTKLFPRSEIFALANQMQRAAVSTTSNIAEGFGRWSHRDKKHFYQQARGSLLELQSQVLVARDLKYIDEMLSSEILEKIEKTNIILLGLIKSVQQQITA